MACMGVHGEDNAFADFADFNITIRQPVPADVTRKMYRGYMASVSYVDDQVGWSGTEVRIMQGDPSCVS